MSLNVMTEADLIYFFFQVLNVSIPVHYNLFITRFVITRFWIHTVKDGSQKCIDYIGKITKNGHFSM